MKRQMFIFSLLSVLLAAGIVMAQTPAHKGTHQMPPMLDQIRPQQSEIHKAVVEFTEPVKLLGAVLKGEYLFLHDEGKMERGEPCTSIYARGETGKFDRLVVSFHCIPVNREVPAEQFKVMISSTNPAIGLPEVLEYRFAGSTEGHKVPQATD
jgi:hypothetical protein